MLTPPLQRIVTRRLVKVVTNRMADEPVVILQGARAVGKSTLLRAVAASFDREIVDLDDLATRDAVAADPTLFLGAPGPVFVDEFQHVPEVLDIIKSQLNVDASPGRFVITGSTSYTTLPVAAQALTGRAHRIDVRPLSQGEVAERRENFAEVLVGDPGELVTGTTSRTSRDEYVGRVVAGGMPMVLRRARAVDRARWLDDYVDLVIERDVMDLARIRQRRLLPRLLNQFASQTGQVLNIARAAGAIGMDKSTAENYTKLLEAVFLVHQLPAWGMTLGARVAAAPKIHLVDSALAARLLRLTEPKLAARSPAALTELGHLLETFVVGELCKQLDWLDDPVSRGHWRTHDGDEIDLVLERGDGLVTAMEVKAGSRVRPEDLAPMSRLRNKLGGSFLGGVIVYTGNRSYTAAERVHVVPIDRLWLA